MNSHYTSLPPDIQQRTHDGIRNLELSGLNGHGKRVPWVPLEKLCVYWDGERVAEVLSHIIPAPPMKAIREQYLRVFTILVLLNKVNFINEFTSHGLNDEYWPRSGVYSGWPPTFSEFFEDFQAMQWKFFPLEFNRHNLIDRRIPADRILPFETVRPIQPIPVQAIHDVTVSEVTIHEPSGRNVREGRRTGKYFLKTYNLSEGDQDSAYRRENAAYTLIESTGSSEHIVKFYGSFQQNGTGNLILEYVGGGTLSNYLRNTLNPQSLHDIYDFWTSVSGLLHGLHKVHQATDAPSPSPRHGIIHQDLKLDNILVHKGTSSQHRYSFLTKLIDFGQSSVGTARGAEKLRGKDNYGNATYSPPEAAHHFEALERGPDTVTSGSDIWALGCIYFQLAAWVAEGFDNMETLRYMRQEELLRHPRFLGSEYANAWHNGADSLDAVQQYHDLIVSQIRVKNSLDEITPMILNIVKENMLDKNPQNRLEPKQIEGAIDNVLRKHKPIIAQRDTKLSSSTSVRLHLPSHPRSGASPSSPIEMPLTIDQCIDDRNADKFSRRRDGQVRSTIDKLRRDLGGRDHLFLIEDSPSMQAYHDDIMRAFTGLSHVAKQLDPDGIELTFLSSPQSGTRSKRITALIEMVQQHTYENDSELMEDKLRKYLQESVLSKLSHLGRLKQLKRKAPITVFIFTDGNWGANQEFAAGVQNPIFDLMNTMRSRGVGRTEVTIQFIRFGNDRHGIEYLSYLDQMGQMANQ